MRPSKQGQIENLQKELDNMRYIDRLQPSDRRRIREIKAWIKELEEGAKVLPRGYAS